MDDYNPNFDPDVLMDLKYWEQRKRLYSKERCGSILEEVLKNAPNQNGWPVISGNKISEVMKKNGFEDATKMPKGI